MRKNCFLEFLNPDTPRMLEKLAKTIQWDAAAKRLKAADVGTKHTKTLLRLFTIELCFGFSDREMQSAAKDSLSVRAFLRDAVVSEETLLAMAAFRLAVRESRSGQLVMNEISQTARLSMRPHLTSWWRYYWGTPEAAWWTTVRHRFCRYCIIFTNTI